MLLIMQTAAVWIFSWMLFHANKLNNPNDPTSRMNYYHPANCRKRALMKRQLAEDKSFGDDDILIESTDLWPLACPTLVTLTSMIVIYLCKLLG